MDYLLPQLSSQDDELVNWVDYQCQESLGFTEPQFTTFLINIGEPPCSPSVAACFLSHRSVPAAAQTSDTVASLRSRLRNQALSSRRSLSQSLL